MRNKNKNRTKVRAARLMARSARIAESDDTAAHRQNAACMAFTREANATNCKRKAKRAFMGRVSIPYANTTRRRVSPVTRTVTRAATPETSATAETYFDWANSPV